MSNFPSLLAFVFGILGNIISILVYLAPVPTFIRIYKRKSTEDFQSLPYLVALFSSSLWLYYALIKQNVTLLISINSIGCVIEIIYIIIFICYASCDKKVATSKFMVLMILLFVSIFLGTKFIPQEPLRLSIVGWICVAVSVIVFAAPLAILRQVIRTKSVEFMPFPLSFFLTLSAVMWFCYGLFTNNVCVLLPNVLGFILGTIQMGLYCYFRLKRAALPEGKKPADDDLKSIVVLSSLGAAEVYPVEVLPYDVQVEKAQDEEENACVGTCYMEEKERAREARVDEQRVREDKEAAAEAS